jgi:hypothetical protein
MMEDDGSSVAGVELGAGRCGIFEQPCCGSAHTDAMQVEDAASVHNSSTAPSPMSQAPTVQSDQNIFQQPIAAQHPELVQESGVEKSIVELPSEAEMTDRLEILCIGGDGPPEGSCGRVSGLRPTNNLVRRAVLVVFRFFRERKPEIRWVTSQAQLDKMDGLAYLLADMLRGELLLEEANAIGKRAHKHVSVDVAKREEKLKEKAKSDRSNARAKAKKDDRLAAILDTTLAEIDARRDAAIVAVWEEEYTGLGLPAENTVVVTQRARPEPDEPDSDEEDELEADSIDAMRAELHKYEADADQADILAEAAALKATRAVEKLQKIPPPGGFRSQTGLEGYQLKLWLEGKLDGKKYDFGDSFPESVRRRRQAEYDHYFSAKARVAKALQAAREASDVCADAHARWREATTVVASLSEARAARHCARVEASDKEVEELKQELAQALLLEAADRRATRERLHAEAAAVWGPGWESRPAKGVAV